ncbi:MAG TPA: acetyl-CoA carboxylase biotin carboxylase subunit [bacterium]|nr:acetyl-CoA carboxylase biotin carboxylase subunit [bacterium]HOY44538.1 acetyl-CoA carboxylase biotin carboxylase subunit [bacterium]HPG82237.1 acetyl-CoA carboxylase biotin carboxylase subunit [bacterium]
MFKKILIANRGEIALRIIRACKELGIATVAVYSEADANSLHIRFADEAVCIGPAPSPKSYLNIPHLISAAEITNAEAIHPGYGFLAENAHFADICTSCGIVFIGPTPEVISLMGDKARAKETMRSAGVPVIPGSDGTVHSVKAAAEVAARIGYPVIIKAVAGGGGRGMRVVRFAHELANAYNTAQSEARAAFSNADLYIEKYFESPRHIEVQLLGDVYGNVVALGERECSVQRKHQKLIEESPSPVVTPRLRREMSAAAVKGAKRVHYSSAGTIEFLLDSRGHFYFMEMNTRIQVEHPVTEMVFGLDLVKEQIRLAAGARLRADLRFWKMRGHALECRINAEDPAHGFRPSPGTITSLHVPGGMGVRVDTHAYAQYLLPPNYDSLIAKLIVHAPTREEAIIRMQRALDEFIVEGIFTTIPLHKQILSEENFRSGNINTSYIEQFILKTNGGKP